MLRALLIILASALFCSCGRSQKPYVRQELLLGTVVGVKFYGDQDKAGKASDEIFAFIEKLHATVNVYDENSEISVLNRTAFSKPVKCSPLLWDIIQAGRIGYEVSGGSFDISSGPLMRLWGFHRKRAEWPDKSEIDAAKSLVGLDKVKFDDSDKTVSFKVSGMFLDFGGIAKGFALDKCREIARSNGIDCGIIDLGGNVYCFPKVPNGRENYNIGIKHPRTGGIAETLALTDKFVATSGDYERYVMIGDRRVTHIVDPSSGLPVEGVASVSVVTDVGVNSDIFSTAIFVGGKRVAERLMKSNPGLQYMIVEVDSKGGFSYTVHGDVWHNESSENE